MTPAPPMATPRRIATATLITAGIVGAVQITVISLTLAVTRTGFDMRRHANSQLVLGDWGWIQTVDFIVFGLLMMAAAIGTARVSRPSRAGLIAAAGVFGYGLGAGVIVGFNPTDPAFGFPPGTPAVYAGYDQISTSARIHGVAGMVGFLAMTTACFAFARYFAGVRRTGWSVASAAMGAAVVVVCGLLGASASAATDQFDFRPTWAVGAALWLYVGAVCVRLRQDAQDAR
ncbi:DUF998 domain-containing protein [Mycobacterium sp. PDNC021]|uniref:DUF998 domain-containing protein n=1 Tax=Mycobacterium sp. PDNC021 TaxID=3391399 RepID=UPI003AAFC538